MKYFYNFFFITRLVLIVAGAICAGEAAAQNALRVYWKRPANASDFVWNIRYTQHVQDEAAAQIVLQTALDSLTGQQFLYARGQGTLSALRSRVALPAADSADPAQWTDAIEKALLPFWMRDESLRHLCSYEITGVSNQEEIDRFNRWTFLPELSGFSSRRNARDQFLDTRYESKETVHNWKAGLSAYRIGKQSRHVSSIEYDLNSYKSLGYSFNNRFVRRGLTMEHSSMFSAGRHTMLGGLISYSTSRQDFFFISPNRLISAMALEHNLFNYGQFYRRYWIMGFRLGHERISASILRPQKSYFGALYTQRAQLTDWGFWQATFHYTLRQFSIKDNSMILNFWDLYKHNFNFQTRVACNIRSGWFFNVDLGTRFGFSHLDYTSRDYHNIRLDVGMSCYFGKGRENVLNPRIRQFPFSNL